MPRCNKCKTYFTGYGKLCDICKLEKTEDDLKCYYCGGPYMGKKCSCKRGLNILEHKDIIKKAENKEITITDKGIAKGLMYFKYNLPKVFKIIPESVKEIGRKYLKEKKND